MPIEQNSFFADLYQSYFGKLKAIAFSQLRNMPVAEELVQETFLKAMVDHEVFCQHEAPFAYLKTTLNYNIKEYRRERNRYYKLFLVMDQELLSNVKAPSNPSPVSIAGILETLQDTLTNDDWFILRSFTLEGASHLQISKALNISVPASQKRLERIRKMLEDVLPDY